MFSERSRYKDVKTDQVTLPRGRVLTAVRFPVRAPPPLAGYHKREEEQRLDHLANFYLNDPAGSWRLCDANERVSPYALRARKLIAIPGKER